MAMKTERKYKMTRVRAGSYLLPSNDGETLWHIYRFEDGRSYGLQDEPDRMWWGCARFRGTFEEASASVIRDLMDMDYISDRRWTETGSYFRSRAGAIEYALASHAESGPE